MSLVWVMPDGLEHRYVGGVFLRVMLLWVALTSVQISSDRLGVREVPVLARCNTNRCNR